MAEELRIIITDEGAPAGGTSGAPAGSGTSGAPDGRRIFNATPINEGGGSGVGINDAIGGAGRVGGALASGNIFSAAKQAITTAGAAAGGAIAAAAGAVAVGLGVAAIAANKFAQVIETQVDRLAAFNADVGLARAETELRREAADRRRASAIGTDLASAERLRGRFEDVMADIGTEVLKALLKILDKMEPIIDAALKAADFVTDGIPVMIDAAIGAIKGIPVLGNVVIALEAIAKGLDAIGFGGDDDGLVGGMDPFAAAFAGEAGRQPFGLPGGPTPFNPFKSPIRAPMFVPPPNVNAGRGGP